MCEATPRPHKANGFGLPSPRGASQEPRIDGSTAESGLSIDYLFEPGDCLATRHCTDYCQYHDERSAAGLTCARIGPSESVCSVRSATAQELI